MESDLLVLDSGALSYFAERREAIRAAFRCALSDDVAIVVPTAVIAEATTGDHRRDANVNRELKKATIVALDERIARSAAGLRYLHRRTGAGTIDAIVVATADAVPGTRVLTGDPSDLRLLASLKGVTKVVGLSEID